MGVAHVGLVHRDPCECKVKGFRAVSSIERNVSSRRHLQGVRQICLRFLEELGKIAGISMWSSMKIWNVECVVEYMFPKGKLPCVVLAQESCTTLRCRDSSGRLTTCMVPGTQKELFLKNLDTLFCGYRCGNSKYQ